MWFDGDFIPTSTKPINAKPGDYFLCTLNDTVYKKNNSNTWDIVANIKGNPGAAGEDGKTFIVSLSSENFHKDYRNVGYFAIDVEIYNNGYEGEATIVSSVGEVYGNTIQIPFNTEENYCVILVSLTGAPTWSKKISALDLTDYGKFLGCLNYVPVTLPEDDRQAVISGDFFVASANIGNDFMLGTAT